MTQGVSQSEHDTPSVDDEALEAMLYAEDGLAPDNSMISKWATKTADETDR